ncbi:MAG: TonB-dependent receptor, partial [Eudoraea sp.]|nr:TonB-dependent receptor [Eudoraea sp.]
TISGVVLEYRNQKPLQDIKVQIEESEEETRTNEKGEFVLRTELKGKQQLVFSYTNMVTKYYPVFLDTDTMNIGPVYMEQNLAIEKTDNLVALTEADLFDNASLETASGLLQATRDVFLSRAAFDFSQAYFKVRGYDSNEGKVLINGIPMNRYWDGRPQWNNWGGLNDVTRNQELDYGLAISENAFGGLLGSTSIDISPSNARPGFRFSASASNRTYRNRIMATYHSGVRKKGLAFSLSISHRWSREGYVDGTQYNAYAFFSAVDYTFSPEHSIGVALINSYNSRGRSAALTDEVVTLLGSKYNPYWGLQEGSIRSSRIRTLHEPIWMMYYKYKSGGMRIRAALAHQSGEIASSRMGYYDAPNPDPIYYRYMPSYYINSPIGANYIGANQAKEALLQNPQWPWSALYDANGTASRQQNAAYVWYDDVNNESSLTGNVVINLALSKKFKVATGISFQFSERHSFARSRDLLGAKNLSDRDPFTNTRNDVNGSLSKEQNEIFNYNYVINTHYWESFLQARFFWKQWDIFVAGDYAARDFQRDGLFLNERYLQNSFGEGGLKRFHNSSLKAGLSYRLTSRHWLKTHAYLGTRAPLLKSLYINPRENHETVPNITNEKVHSVDLSYLLRMPKLTARVSSYYTRFQNATEGNFFYVDAGVGSDFVQEVVTGLDKLHRGVELGVVYDLSTTTKVSFVTAFGEYQYASDPNITINFDTVGAGEDLQRSEGNIDLGIAGIKNYRMAQGPQTALSLGMEYRDPSYWWIAGTANYLAHKFIDIAMITRTASFKIDPDTGIPFPEATEEKVRSMLAQESLSPVYLLNLIGGKSWLYNDHYISVFCSVNNLFDVKYKTGGYEQSRNGNYGQMLQDNLSGSPSFGPKYWHGFGRTFFLNVAVSF